MTATHTYTYAVLEVSPAAYDEIKTKLLRAGHKEAVHAGDKRNLIDMQGIALRRAPQ